MSRGTLPRRSRQFAALLAGLLATPLWLRIVAGLLWVIGVVELFYLGQKPVAVGLVQAPWDKLLHLGFYGALGGLLWLAAGGLRARSAVLFLILMAVGSADEWVQSLTPGRSAGFDDLAFDALGALIALTCMNALARHFRRR